MNERRHEPRIPLENMYYVTVVSANRELPSVLLDLSVSGARVGLPPNAALPPVGSEVSIKDPVLPLLDKRTATVMWGMGVQLGVRFTQRIDASLDEMAKLLQSEIFY